MRWSARVSAASRPCPSAPRWTRGAASRRRTDALLFVMGTQRKAADEAAPECTHTGIWGMRDGVVGTKDGRGALVFDETKQREFCAQRSAADAPSPTKTDVEPLCVYERHGALIAVDPSELSAQFVAQFRPDLSVVDLWDLQAVKPGRLVVEPDGPASLLVIPGDTRTFMQLTQTSHVADMSVTKDPEGNPALVVGCDDGSAVVWDLAGDDRGQIIAQLRSLRPLEILVPVILLCTTTAQMFSFAFGPAIPWEAGVHEKATFVHRVTVFDFKCMVTIHKELVFWPEILIIVALISMFIATSFLGLDELTDHLVAKCTNWKRFRSEGNRMGPAHLVMKAVSVARSAIYGFMQLAATLLVVPIMKAAAAAFHCSGDPAVVHFAPTVHCWEGPHLKLTILLAILLPAFMYTLLPNATVGGDSRYVPSTSLFDYKFWQPKNAWRLAAARKATTLYMDFLHLHPWHAFEWLSVDLFGKIFIPVVATLAQSRPKVQMCLITSINIFVWVHSVRHAPYLDRRFCIVVQDFKLLICVSSATGIFTTLRNDPHSFLPVYILVGAFVLVLVLMVVQLRHVAGQSPRVLKIDMEELAKQALQARDVESPLLNSFNDSSRMLIGTME